MKLCLRLRKEFFVQFRQWDIYPRSTERIFLFSWSCLGFGERRLSYHLRYTCCISDPVTCTHRNVRIEYQATRIYNRYTTISENGSPHDPRVIWVIGGGRGVVRGVASGVKCVGGQCLSACLLARWPPVVYLRTGSARCEVSTSTGDRVITQKGWLFWAGSPGSSQP